jgi:hypothetical protein
VTTLYAQTQAASAAIRRAYTDPVTDTETDTDTETKTEAESE